MDTKIAPLLKRLKADSKQHERVGPKLTRQQVDLLEAKMGLKLPASYRAFLQDFGDGAYWLYGCQAVDTISDGSDHRLLSVHADAPEYVGIDGDGQVPSSSLLSLMSEDSNGGAWCWLTSRERPDGEWPLAYYHPLEETLFYEVPTFVNWLSILVDNKNEVIRVLDRDDRLELG